MDSSLGASASGETRRSWPRYVLYTVLILASFAPHVWSLTNNDRGDVPYYFEWTQKLLGGMVPYRDFRVEYPPYALLWFLAPGLMQTEPDFQLVFAFELLLIDAGLKLLLLVEGRRLLGGWKGFVPFAVFAVAGTIQYTLYVKRFDLVLGAITFLAVLALWRGAYFASGLLLACGTATKLYPVLLVPVFASWLWKRKQADSFILGLGTGMVPLALISLEAPWWRFMAYHQERGLQVESVYAGFIWLAHRLDGTVAFWLPGHGGYDVSGPLAATVLPCAKVLFVAAVGVSVAVASWRAYRADDDLGTLARLALLPVLAFVAFNYVLSPQYMIWIMGFVVLAILKRWSWPLVAILGALSLTQLIFGPTYWGGLELSLTVVLCARNTLLIAAWVGLLIELLRRRTACPRALL